MGRPVMHFEIASPNLERAAAFYEELFDWRVGDEQMDGYRLVGTDDGSIGGGLLRTPEGVFPYVTVYVGVEDLKETLERAEGTSAARRSSSLCRSPEPADSRCSRTRMA